MSKKITVPKAIKGYGYSGSWNAPMNTIGWNTTPFVSGPGDRKYPGTPVRNENTIGVRFFLCEITIKPLLDKKGRPITKIMK